VNTLFQEIATDYPPSHPPKEETGGGAGRDEKDAASGSESTRTKCYAELLEEASALCAYLTPPENAIVTTVASSCLLSFLIPHCHFQGFLRSYFAASSKNPPSASKPDLSSLEERLVNATLSNQNHTSGGAFPYSASRMRSLVADDDGFTSSSFHRFLCQGLCPYLSCGMPFNLPSKEVGSKNNTDDVDAISVSAIMFQAGTDLIQLLAMAICPNPPSENDLSTAMTTSLTTVVNKGTRVGFDDVRQLANSILPFSFQLSYSDRFQLVRLCTELVIPEREESAFDAGYATGLSSKNGRSSDNRNGAMFGTVICQLRLALFGFASYNAHSEKDAGISFKALANVALNEGKSLSIQVEFQRLLQATIQARSEYLAFAIGGCLEELVTRYNGSRYYADGEFVRFALGLIGEIISDSIRMGMADSKKKDLGLTIGTTTYKVLMNENANKRQKTGSVLSTRGKYKPYHLVALLKVARPLFYFLLDSNTAKKAKEEGGLVMEAAEHVAKSQLVKDITLLLCYPSSLSVVQSASQALALALAYNGKYMSEKSSVKHLFRFTRQALDNASGAVDTVQALRTLVITASRQSRTFATSLLSYAVKCCSKNKRMAWKIATLVSFARPSVVSNRLAELEGCSQGSVELSGDIARDEIMTYLSCSLTYCTSASSAPTQRCISLAEGVKNHWSLFQLVRYSFVTSNFGFAHLILNQRQLPQNCSGKQNFMWLTILSKIARAEVILGNNGAIGLSDSLEAFHSCHSALSSLAASVPNNPSQKVELGKFGFQREFLQVRIEFLELCMITRSLCSEIVLTGGNVSSRSNLCRRNIPKSFGMLASSYIKIYQLHGLHYCQQTRSVLRTFIALSQIMKEFVEVLLYCESKPNANKKQQEVVDSCSLCYPKGDERYSMGSLIKRLRVGVLEKIQVEKSKERTVLQAPELMNLLDILLRCPSPFPPGFFRVKSIPYSCVNLSADAGLLPKKQNDDHISVDTNGAEYIELTPGLPFKLILSGTIPEEFIRSADVEFNQIISGKIFHYEGQLYEDDETEDTGVASGNARSNLPMLNDPFSTTLQPNGQFVLPILCEPIMREGFYRIELKLGCRDVRCTEWSMPTLTPLEMILRVEDYSE